MKIYHYHKETGEFLQESKAQKNPVSDEYLIPAHSTDIRPPKEKEGSVRVFRSGWRYVTDHRGKVVYNKATKQAAIYQNIDFDPNVQTMLAVDKPKRGEYWDIKEQAWTKKYGGVKRIVEPFARIWSAIIYVSDVAHQKKVEADAIQRYQKLT